MHGSEGFSLTFTNLLSLVQAMPLKLTNDHRSVTLATKRVPIIKAYQQPPVSCEQPHPQPGSSLLHSKIDVVLHLC